MENPLKTLVLAAHYPHRASYYDDWADAFASALAFKTTRSNVLHLSRATLTKELDEHDLIILLHSCTGDTTHWLHRLAPTLAHRRQARLIAFVGNEYNSSTARIADKITCLRACRPDMIATQLLEEAGRYLYAGITPKIVSVPHALNPKIFRPGAPDGKKLIDIGVRNFRYSALLGDEDRNRIIDHFRNHGAEYGLSVNIKGEHRFGREGWAAFLRSCRGTISSEAGSWYLDRDDGLITRIIPFVESKRSGFVIGDNSWARRFVRQLPVPAKLGLAWVLRHGPLKYDAFEESKLDFSVLYERFFRDAPRCPVYSKAISSRHLDAAGTQTCQILVRGRYNDILSPGEHYIPVAPGLSDIAEAVARFKDCGERGRIALAAYEHVVSHHTYAHRLATLYKLACDLW